ncbi:MAG TPA: radical SAM protein [Bryobacteraceae bacterium]|nr:radical SAM protein [Bryobacteraceae bacterium]
MKPAVYLADLRYDYSGVLANDCMPLGIAYMKAVMDRDLPQVRSRLFVYPDKLWDAIKFQPPDVLMLSNYMWCEALSFHFAKLVKQRRPETLVVMGGPNIPIEAERQIAYVRQHPEIDLYVLGEGDFLATEVVKEFLNAGMKKSRMLSGLVPSSIYWRPDGSVHLEKAWERHKEVDEIPSPWLTGIQDEFFDGRLAPLIETNRGCPFTCTFCVQGTRWYTKVHNFSLERMREEVRYIARRIHSVCPNMGTLRIADSNYGMFERDIEISGYLGETQKEFGWPTYIDATTGKNRADRIIKSVEKVSGALVLYQAVQSLDENVLRNVKRQTIKLEAYQQLQVHLRGRGLRSNSDLILGLPGETLESHMRGIRDLLDAGVSQVTNFQLMLLKGSELEMLESRNMFQFRSMYRVLPKNFGIYGGQKVLDVEEIVVSTDTLTFEDYVRARKHALASVAFWHDNNFIEAVRFASKRGVSRADWLFALVPAMEADTGKVNNYLQSFERETRGELFPTREACIEFYLQDENWDRLMRSEIGDNLLHKYQAIASFHIWPEICALAMSVTMRLIMERGTHASIPNFEEFWENFSRYQMLQHAHGHSVEEILAPARGAFRYDIDRWIADDMPLDPSPYRLAEPREFEFRLSSERHRELSAALATWSAELKGLTKMMKRIRVVWLVRDCAPAHADLSRAYAHASLGAGARGLD